MADFNQDVSFPQSVTVSGDATFTGAVDLSVATVTLPTGQTAVKRYTSQRIAMGDVTSGATQSIALTGEPTGAIPIAAYIECYSPAAGVSSTSGNTTGLTVEVGTADDPDGYVKSVSIFGVTGKVTGGVRGDMIGCYRGTDALLLKLTATGGSNSDVAHIAENLDLKVVVIYLTAIDAF